MTPEFRARLTETAEALGVSPVDLATVISYETGGTFDPAQPGPRTKWGQHKGLIQFGEPQAQQYGVDWSRPLESQLGKDGAVVRYLTDRGFQRGGSLLDMYSTINAGAPGLYNRSDAAAGGMPGTVRDKVETQFAPHRERAMALLAAGGGTMTDANNDPMREAARAELARRNGGQPQGATPAPAASADDLRREAAKAELERRRKEAEAKRASTPGLIDGVGRAAADLAFFGYGDNVAAGIGALAGGNPETGEWLDYSKPIGERYDANLAMEREKRAAFAESNPGANFGAELAGAVTGATLLGRAVPVRAAPTLPWRVAQASAGGAIQGGVTAAGMADGEGDNRILQGAQGGALGLVLGPVAIPVASLFRRLGEKVGGAVSRVFGGKPSMFDPATGRVTDEGRRQLAAIGVNVNEVSAQVEQAFAEAARNATRARSGREAEMLGEVAARTAPAQSFDIPLTRGQATGEIPQIAAEEAMRAGARGNAAFREMDEFGRRQRGAVDVARTGLGREVAPGGGEADAVDAAQMAMDGVRREARRAKAAGRLAYREFEATGGGVRGETVGRLRNNVGMALEREGIIDGPDLTNANRARQYMDAAFKGAEKGAIPFTRLEAVRQNLRRYSTAAYKGNNADDQRAMDAIIKEYDDFLQSSVDTALTEGDGAAMEAVRKARGLWAEYLKTYTGKKGADNYIRKIVEDELSPDQVVGWLFGASKNIGGGQSSLIAKRFRDILGADSAEFQALKKAAFDRLTMKGDAVRGPDDMVSALGEFLDGKGKTLSQTMFTPQELRRIREFREAMRALQVPQKAANRSGSGYEVARAGQALARGLAASLGFATGGAGGAVVGAAGAGAAADFANRLAAKAATQGITGPAPSITSAVGLAGGAGAIAAGESPIR